MPRSTSKKAKRVGTRIVISLPPPTLSPQAREYIRKKGYAHVAREAGRSLKTIQSWVSGDRIPDPDAVQYVIAYSQVDSPVGALDYEDFYGAVNPTEHTAAVRP